MNVAGLVLAAGAGTRFGGPKAMGRIGDRSFIDRALDVLEAGGCAPLIAVLGASAADVVADSGLDRRPGLRVVVAGDWSSGMAASLRAGLQAAAQTDADAVVISLVDQPWLSKDAVARVIAARGSASAAVAHYGNVPGHPILLERPCWSDVAASASGETGARTWLRSNPDRATAVDCTGLGDPRDVDRPADLAR